MSTVQQSCTILDTISTSAMYRVGCLVDDISRAIQSVSGFGDFE